MPGLVEDGTVSDTGLSCFVVLARIPGIPADPEQIRHRQAARSRAMDSADLLRTAKSFGLKARVVTTTWERLAAIPLPAIARRKDGRFIIIAGIDGDRMLIQDPLEPRPLTLARAVVEPAWTGELLLMTRRAGGGARSARPPSASAGTAPRRCRAVPGDDRLLHPPFPVGWPTAVDAGPDRPCGDAAPHEPVRSAAGPLV